jgi:hypothetical protein
VFSWEHSQGKVMSVLGAFVHCDLGMWTQQTRTEQLLLVVNTVVSLMATQANSKSKEMRQKASLFLKTVCRGLSLVVF